MEQKHKVFNLIILDESGSMESIKKPTINAFNELVQTTKEIERRYPQQQHFISLTTFNGLGIKEILINEPVEHLSPIDEQVYNPISMTPLFDSMGLCITKLRHHVKYMDRYNVLVTILTDGEENNSKEYTRSMIKTLVSELSSENWTFTYIGANHDVMDSASSISITNILVFEASSMGMNHILDLEKRARMRFSQRIQDGDIEMNNFFYDELGDKV